MRFDDLFPGPAKREILDVMATILTCVATVRAKRRREDCMRFDDPFPGPAKREILDVMATTLTMVLTFISMNA